MRSRAVTIKPSLVVWLLGASQIIGYGTLYYSFSILAGDIADEFAWPESWVYGSFSLALIAGGILAPLIGKRIDRHGAAAVMALGSALAAAALGFAAFSPNAVTFTVALIVVQSASALVLYDAAFAALVQTTGPHARLRINHLTLIAGFASTIFWPLTSFLHGLLDWREVLLVFAALNLTVCFPIHLLLAANSEDENASAIAPSHLAPTSASHAPFPPGTERRLLWLVTAGFALSGFALSAILAQMVPMLTAVGLGTSALLVSALFGPAQVLVRFANMIVGVRQHPLRATIVAMTLLPVSVAVLLLSAPMLAGAVVFAILLGFCSGLKSIVIGTLPLALFGSGAYGARLGNMALPRQLLAAVAPFALAWLIGNADSAIALATLAAVAVLGLIAFLEVARIRNRLMAPIVDRDEQMAEIVSGTQSER